MAPEEFERLQSRYAMDADFRQRLDDAASADEAIALLAVEGWDATASDLAQIGGAYAEIDLDLIDQLAGGEAVDPIKHFNFTAN